MYEKIVNLIKQWWLIILMALIVFIRLPYVVYAPGTAIDVSDRIEIEDKKINGSINMTSVTVYDGSIPFLLASYILPSWDIMSKSDLTYDNISYEDSIKIDELMYQQSMDFAIISAYNEAGFNVNLDKLKINIVSLDKNSKSDFKIGDQIIKIGQKELNNTTQLVEEINMCEVGDKINFTVLRDGKEQTVQAEVYELDDEKIVGIVVVSLYEYQTDPKVIIETKKNENGPSGGFIMALTIYDLLSDEDLINGRKIAGTGTIDEAGNVGEIGGVKYKVAAAHKNKASIFFCPEDNYEEAKKEVMDHKYDIEVVKISSLKEAIDYLREN